jgi:hypothetical protein
MVRGGATRVHVAAAQRKRCRLIAPLSSVGMHSAPNEYPTLFLSPYPCCINTHAVYLYYEICLLDTEIPNHERKGRN